MTDADTDQWQAAARVILGLLKLQTEQPGAVGPEDLHNMVRMAAGERDRQGDYGAARLLDEWAVILERPFSEWG